MKLCFASKMRFSCEEIHQSTTHLAEAMEWVNQGYSVEYSYDGERVGFLSYAGECDTPDDLPSDSADYGAVYRCKSDGAYYICTQDEICDKMPEE